MAGPSRRDDRQRGDEHQAAHDRLEDRIIGRVEDSLEALAQRSEASFQVVVESLGSLQKDVRRGQIERQAILGRLGELEIAVGENRDATNKLRERVEEVESGAKEVTKEALVEAAPEAAVAGTKGAGREVWSSLSTVQKTAATVAAVVAILAGLSGAMTGLERIARGGWEGLRTAWVHARGPEKPTD